MTDGGPARVLRAAGGRGRAQYRVEMVTPLKSVWA